MKIRLLGLALLCISALGFILVFRHAGAETPGGSNWWEALLSLVCVPVAAVGPPLLLFGPALVAPVRRGGSISVDEP
jgi:lysylphosphatidylglycerol synthetase-like protein (DUF2156 family)